LEAAAERGKFLAGLGAGLARQRPLRVVRFQLRQRLAVHVAQAIQPRHWLLAREMIVNAVDQEAVRRIAAVVGEDGDAGLPRRDEAHQRAPTEPAPGVPDNALAAVARRAEAEPVMAVTDFLIFGGGFVDPRRLHLPDQLR